MKIPTKPLVWCTFIVVEIILLKLGFWQYARYTEKNQQLILYQSAQNLPTLTSFANVTVEDLTFYRKIAVSGQWLTDYSFYVAHKINHKRLGFWVYTPLKVGLHTIVVQHGWVSVADHDVNQPAKVESTSLPHQWIGEIIPPPRSQNPTKLTKIGVTAHGKKIYQSFSLDQLSDDWQMPVMALILQSQPLLPGVEAVKQVAHINPNTNLAYSFQWFALAATLATLAIYRTATRKT